MGFAESDLRYVVDLGLERGGHLLTAGEMALVRRILALPDHALELYARLSSRVGEIFACDLLDEGWAELVAVDLADHAVSRREKAEASTVSELKAACRRLGVSTGGRKDALVARLQHVTWTDRRFLRLRGGALVRRLERWAFLSAWRDRSTLVVERLGHVTWPDYPVTSGVVLHPHRRSLLAWEAVLHTRADDPFVLLDALDRGDHVAPARLHLGRPVRRHVAGHARELERAGQTAQARHIYQRLMDGGHCRPGRYAVRVARTLEAEGLHVEALEHLREARRRAEGADTLAILRAGRRIARSVRARWAPDRPLRKPKERHVRLPGAVSTGPRPTYATPSPTADAATVEDAVIAWLAELGRTAVHAEGSLWATLFALLFAETFFLPVPGALPVRHLAGPLDLGTPAFRARRTDAVDVVLAAVAAGEAPGRVAAADARWRDVRLLGANWAWPTELLVAVAGMPPTGLLGILEALLNAGFRAHAGMPDLVVLPGRRTKLPDAIPARVPSGLLLVEVKGPGDTVRDEQSVWFDRLVGAGVPTELWSVSPR